ncbi:MAG: hypothetical protein LBJ20_05300 [Candidatus Methanoplasma sp.]|nr:hypothetical protein [Candidatus Methanoplasma sp.]
MDKEKALKEIQSNIRAGKTELASKQTAELSNCFSDDPLMLLTCASLLKVTEDEKGAETIAERIPGSVRDTGISGLEVAKGLRGIGFPAEAEEILSGLDESEEVIRERMRALFDMRMYEESSLLYKLLNSPTTDDSAVMIEAVSAGGEHDSAVNMAENLLGEAPDDPTVMRCYCTVLSVSGKRKEAGKFVKDNLKKDKSSPNANALAAYYLWTDGKSASAGAYASKAIRQDPGNIMAMEILAYCLAEKGKSKEAKIIAGAINENEPGNSAVVRILDMCRIT